MPLGPREALIAVTYRCNSKCRMCDIWKREQTEEEVEPSFYFRLPLTLKSINITGGEPFLRQDLFQITQVMAQRLKHPRIIVSSNGLLTERIEEYLKRALHERITLALRISIDGMYDKHDEIRGVKGAFQKALASLEVAKKIGVRDIGIGFTLESGNEEQLLNVYELAEQLKVQFTATIAHDSPIFFGFHKDIKPESGKAVKAFSALLERQWVSKHPKDWFRAFFTKGVIDYISGIPKIIQCAASRGFFFLDPQGNAYPCHLLNAPIGNLSDANYVQLLEKSPEILDRVDTCSMRCWMTCTVAPWMRSHLFSVTAQVLKEKVRRFL